MSVHTLQLTTISPVSIGSGNILSPYKDFFVSDDKKQVVYLDPEVMRTALRRKATTDAQVIDRYMALIETTMSPAGNKARVSAYYLSDELGISPEDFTERYRAYGLEDVQDPKIKLHETIRNARQPYIAGSTLKGAIKTALLYHWLTKTLTGKKQLDHLMAVIEKAWADNKGHIELRDAIKLKEKEKQYRHNDDLRTLSRSTNDLDKEISKILDSFLSHKAPKGKTTEGRDDFHNLLLSDTNPLPETTIEIHKVERLNLKNGNFEMRQLRACIAGEQALHSTLRITPRFEHPDLQFLNGKDALEQVLAQIRRFSIENLRFEQEQLNDQQRYLPAHIATPLGDFLEQRLRDLEPPEPHTLLRLGAGKTWYYNAMGLAVWLQNKTTFTHMRHLFEIGKPRQEKFPLTKVLASAVLQPLGWVAVMPIPDRQNA